MKKYFENWKNIFNWLVYIMIFFLPWQTKLILKQGNLNGHSEYAGFSLYIIDFLIIILFLSWIIFQKNKKTEKIIIIGLMALIFSSSIYAAFNLEIAFYGFIRLILGSALLIILAFSECQKTKILLFFIFGASFQALLGIWQFIIQKSLANKYIGIAEHLPETLGTSVIEFSKNGLTERYLRSYGGLDHPNILGGLLAFALIINIFLLFKFFEHQKNKKIRMFLYFSLVTILIGLLLTFSKSALIAAFIGSLFLIIKNFKNKKIWPIIGVLFFTILIIYPTYHKLFFQRMSYENRLEKKSIDERKYGYLEALKVISSNPGGIGLNNYTPFLHKKYPCYQGYLYQPVHNTFLLIISELGWLLFLVFFLILFFLVKNKNQNQNDQQLKISLFAAWIIIGLFDHYFWSLHFGILLSFFILALSIKKSAIFKS